MSGSGHEVRVKDYFYYGERPHDEDPDDDEEFPEEKDYDKYRALKRYTEYATPEHWETIKKNLGDESAVWRKQGYPINNDDLNEDVKEVIVRRSRRVSKKIACAIVHYFNILVIVLLPPCMSSYKTVSFYIDLLLFHVLSCLISQKSVSTSVVYFVRGCFQNQEI